MLLPKAMKAFEFAVSRTAAFFRTRVLKTSVPEAIPIRINPRQPIHPIAALRQSRSAHPRFFSTAARRIASLNKALNPPSSSRQPFPTSATRTLLSKTTLAPFSSPLRPNLTGGTLPRAAGGYSLGGRAGVRAFSHVPAAQAQLVQNVSAAVRAFCVQGFRPQYEGTDPKTGRARFGAVTAQIDKVARTVARFGDKNMSQQTENAVLGTSVTFRIAPAVTGLSMADGALGQAGVLEGLAADFEAHKKELDAVQKDLNRLAALGPALGVELTSDGTSVEVRFPGCDGESVSRLCQELGVLRGIVRADEGWEAGEAEAKEVAMALLFPLAPGPGSNGAEFFEPASTGGPKQQFGTRSLDWKSMLDDTGSQQHTVSCGLGSFVLANQTPESQRSHVDHWYSDADFDEVGGSDLASNESLGLGTGTLRPRPSEAGTEDYEGMQGIYRFLSQLEAAER